MGFCPVIYRCLVPGMVIVKLNFVLNTPIIQFTEISGWDFWSLSVSEKKKNSPYLQLIKVHRQHFPLSVRAIQSIFSKKLCICVSMNRIWNVFLNIKNKNMVFIRLLLIRINYFEVVLSLDEVGSSTLCVYSVEPLLCLSVWEAKMVMDGISSSKKAWL